MRMQAGQSNKRGRNAPEPYPGLTSSIVPATGPRSGTAWCRDPPELDLPFLAAARMQPLALSRRKSVPSTQHPVQDDGELAGQRDLRLAHAGALGQLASPSSSAAEPLTGRSV